MSLPVLLILEERPDALAPIETQLAERYGRDYHVEAFDDPDEAARALDALANSGTELALVLVGQSAATAADGAFLDRVRRIHPHAKRALLVPFGGWADDSTTEAFRAALALGRIDHYVPEPMGSPDEVFHEAVSSFLLESARDRRTVPHTVHIVGESWSGRAFELRTVFERCAATHSFCLADSDEGRKLMAKAGADARLPIMILPDGRVLSDPSDAEIAEAAGAAPGEVEGDSFDLVVVGSGPAGLSAAVYSASDGVRTLVVDEGGIGGQARSSSLIRNYLGFAKGISGGRLAEQAHEQALSFGAKFLFMHRVTDLSRSDERLTVALDGSSVSARAVILATGVSYRRLGVDSLDPLNGAGVFYGGPGSEAPGLVGKDVYVAGGGNSAGQAALHLARYARTVTIVIRADSIEAGMSHYLVQAVEATPNVHVRTGTTVVGGGGEGHLQELVLHDKAGGEETTVSADALFVLIGARPHTEWLPQEVLRDDRGFVLTGDDLPSDEGWPLERRPFALETSMPGVLAAGDVRHASVKRVASAVGEGSIAAQLVHSLFAYEAESAALLERA
jgi:thioredoxin reductase (NADPH)